MKLLPGPIPLYYQLENGLRARIHSDEFVPGSLLPTEERLCEDYGVSRITVRRALDALTTQGLIVQRRGVGRFVAETRHGVRSVRLIGSLDEFLASAGALDTQFLSLRTVDPPDTAAVALRLSKGENAVRLEMTSSLEGSIVGYLELFFPVWIGQNVNETDIVAGIPIIRMIEQKFNLRISRAEQLIRADVAGERAAEFLGLRPTDPILSVARTYFSGDGRPIEAVFVRNHPDRYQYAIDFHAGPGNR